MISSCAKRRCTCPLQKVEGRKGGRQDCTRLMELRRVGEGGDGGHVGVTGRDVFVDAGVGGVDLFKEGREGGREGG